MCPTRPSKDIPGIPATRPSKGIPDIPVVPDLPVISDIPVIHDLQALPGNSTSSSISRESTPFQHSPIRMHILHILQFDWFPQKTPPSTSWTIQTTDILQTLHSSKKGRCCDIGQTRRYSPEYYYSLQSSCHQELLITRMTFTSFSSSLSDQESTEITINTYRC